MDQSTPEHFSREITPTMVRRDLLLAAAMAFAGGVFGVGFMTSGMMQFSQPLWLVVLTSVLLAAPLALRRRAPLVGVLLCTAVFITGYTIGSLETAVSQVVYFLSFYSAGAWGNNRARSFMGRVAVLVINGAWFLVTGIQAVLDPSFASYGGWPAFFGLLVVRVGINVGYFAGAWVFGERTWRTAEQRHRLDAAQAEIKAQQALLTEQAISLERLRIARELHDVVAHHVSAMGIQAGAARRVVRTDVDKAEAALRSVEEGSRSAIAELGNLVGALRSADDSLAPSPTVADLRDLVATSNQHTTVSYSIIGEPRELSGPVELTLYRVVQEALTNVRKHAGAGAAADVRLRYLADAVEVEISDDGRGTKVGIAGLGVGQTGMTERVAAVGGSVTMGPQSRGGYLVRAHIPIIQPDSEPTGVMMSSAQPNT